jgi:creatinine amidohydrolase/Fe(II)-dependent formamide hydrolase-like protein
MRNEFSVVHTNKDDVAEDSMREMACTVARVLDTHPTLALTILIQAGFAHMTTLAPKSGFALLDAMVNLHRTGVALVEKHGRDGSAIAEGAGQAEFDVEFEKMAPLYDAFMQEAVENVSKSHAGLGIAELLAALGLTEEDEDEGADPEREVVPPVDPILGPADPEV